MPDPVALRSRLMTRVAVDVQLPVFDTDRFAVSFLDAVDDPEPDPVAVRCFEPLLMVHVAVPPPLGPGIPV